MKRIRIVCLIIICVLCISVEQEVFAITKLDGNLYALSAVLMDAESGRILYEKEGNVIRPMASTTKIMTCIIALEYGDLNSLVEVSKYAASMPDVQMNIKKGQIFTLKDLLYSLMLESHNDSAVAIAECVGGTVEEFAALMNEKAREIGCMNTYFITPNGLDASVGAGDDIRTHSTTAVDLAKIMRYCMGNKEFLEITQTYEYIFFDKEIDDNGNVVDGRKAYKVINRNTLLKNMKGIITGKTGFTNDAGYCYVCAYENDGRTYIVALLGCGWPNNKNYKWIDSKKLLKYGSENYYKKIYYYEDVLLPQIKIKNGIKGEYYDFGINGHIDSKNLFIDTYVDAGEFVILLQQDESVDLEINIAKELKAPVKAGQKVGSIKYVVGDTVLEEINVYASENIDQKDFLWSFGVVFTKFIFQ